MPINENLEPFYCADIIPFPTKLAKYRLVPFWQRRGELKTFPHPVLRNEAYAIKMLLNASVDELESLVHDIEIRERFILVLESDYNLFYLMVMDGTRRIILNLLGFDDDDLNAFFADETIENELTDPEIVASYQDFRRHCLDEMESNLMT